jgi:hypothetical protein
VASSTRIGGMAATLMSLMPAKCVLRSPMYLYTAVIIGCHPHLMVYLVVTSTCPDDLNFRSMLYTFRGISWVDALVVVGYSSHRLSLDNRSLVKCWLTERRVTSYIMFCDQESDPLPALASLYPVRGLVYCCVSLSSRSRQRCWSRFTHNGAKEH